VEKQNYQNKPIFVGIYFGFSVDIQWFSADLAKSVVSAGDTI